MAATTQKVLAAAATIGIAEPALALAHTGPVGVIVGIALGAVAYTSFNDIEKLTGREFPSLPVPHGKIGDSKESLVYRIIHGKSTRLVGSLTDEPSVSDLYNELIANDPQLARTHARISHTRISEDDDEEKLRLPVRAAIQTFSQMLRRFTPSLEQIYLATLEDGTPVYSTSKGLCHVALAGSTGGGKSSLIRLIMCQLCSAKANVLLLNPHYTRYDLEEDEDWTPFEPYLVEDPMECRKYENIEFFLKQIADELLPKRLDKYARSQPWADRTTS